MSLLGWSETPPKKRSATYKGTQFEIFIEGVLKHCGDYKSIMRNIVFRIERGSKSLYSSQIDICCRLDPMPMLNNLLGYAKHRYGLFELKYSTNSDIDEKAVKQLLGSCSNLTRGQSDIIVEPMAVVTNKGFTSGACGLAGENNVGLISGKELEGLYWIASRKYEKIHFISTMFSRLFSGSSFDDLSIDDKIKSITVEGKRTAPDYVHVHV
jgi:hypothetical protein